MTTRGTMMQKAWDGLFMEMRRGGVTFTKQKPTNPDAFMQHLITSVNGVEDVRVCSGIELREEIGADMVYRSVQRVPRIRFIIGTQGGWRGSRAPDRKQFPQRKTGFDYVKIVDAILKHVEWVQAASVRENVESARYDRNERQLKLMTREFRDVTNYVQVKDNGSFKFSIETDDATIVRRLLRTVKGR